MEANRCALYDCGKVVHTSWFLSRGQVHFAASSSPSTPLLVTGTFAMICSLCWAGNNDVDQR